MKKVLKFAALIIATLIFIPGIETTTAQTWAPTNGPFGGGISCLAKSNTHLFAGSGNGGIYGNGAYRSANNGTKKILMEPFPSTACIAAHCRQSRIMSECFIGEKKHQFMLESVSPGIYLVRIMAGDKVEMLKLIKQL